MKTLKEIYYLLAYSLIAIGFTACQEDGPAKGTTWDFYPIEFRFTLTGENGEDLLNPATPGTYAGLKITATYDGETYVKDAFKDNKVPYRSRAILAQLYGIYTIQLDNGQYALQFGELNGDDTYEDATITLDWGDGTRDVITFSSRLKWKGHDPVFKRSYKLNGEEVDKDTCWPTIDIKKKGLGKDATHDIEPVVFSIFLRNKQGYDLLNNSVEGHVYRDSIRAIFQGKEYYVNKDISGSRTYTPSFTGLTLPWHNQNITQAYPLYFGELDGTKTFDNDTIIMVWDTLGRDTITFTSKMEWKDDKAFFTRSYSLNGEEVDKATSRPIIHIWKTME